MPTTVVKNKTAGSHDDVARHYTAIAGANEARRFSKSYDTIEYTPLGGWGSRKLYFKLGKNDELLEWRNVAGKDGWVEARDVTRYYYADGKLYSSAGRCLGAFALNISSNSEIEGRRFLAGWGTWQRGRG